MISSGPSHTPSPQPITLRALLRELSDEFLNLDRGLLYTFAQTWIAPNEVVRRYVAQRDPRLTRPIRYLLIAMFITTAATWFVMSKLGLAARLGATPKQLAQSEFLLQNTGWILVLVLPMVLVVLRLFDRHRGEAAWASAAVAASYTQAQALWVQLLLVVPLAFLPWRWPVLMVSALMALWLVVAWTRYLGRQWWRAVLGALLAIVLGTLTNQLVMYGLLKWNGLI